jgi:serine/threonine-protein kinase HipA
LGELVLDVRLDGFSDPTGTLARNDFGGLTFAYNSQHLANANAIPLSLSLPLTDEPYGDVLTRAFFDNLLQESGAAISNRMAREGLSRDDIAGLLEHLGKDCPGALSVLPAGAPPAKVPGDFNTDYRPISDKELASIVKALHECRPLPRDTADPSPLAGVQSKIALTLLPNGQFAEPKAGSGAPTTHIIKVPDRAHPRDALHEAATLNLSRALDIETANAHTMTIGNIDALVITRFDRALDGKGLIIRIHQEDFAQAMGLPSQLKYERDGKAERKFTAGAIHKILDSTINPIGEREKFIRATLFDLMTGNVDAHAKNHALMHLGAGRIRTTPRYDLLPTRLDPNLTVELAFKIGDATTLDAITAKDFNAFLKDLGIPNAAAQRRITQRYATSIANNLAEALAALDQNNMKAYADLIAANMRQLLPALGLDVPHAAQNRDAFIERDGGWLTS